MIYSIYKLVCDDCPDFIYVGSTGCFKQRKWKHKSTCYNENVKGYNYKLYQTMRQYGGFANWRMIELCKVECETKRDAERIEEDYRLKLKGNLNMRCCFIAETRQEYHKEYCKEYRQVNKQQIKEQNKVYYEANKDKIKERESRIVTCECGCEVTSQHLSRHQKTKKHNDLLNFDLN